VALAVQVVLAARGAQEALAVQAVLAVREAPAVLVAQAAAKLEHARVVAGLELVPAAEPAVNPVEAQVLVQVAAPARIKSVTAVHHLGLVRVPKKAEDLAAVAAATMHVPAVTEAATAWAVAE